MVAPPEHHRPGTNSQPGSYSSRQDIQTLAAKSLTCAVIFFSYFMCYIFSSLRKLYVATYTAIDTRICNMLSTLYMNVQAYDIDKYQHKVYMCIYKDTFNLWENEINFIWCKKL